MTKTTRRLWVLLAAGLTACAAPELTTPNPFQIDDREYARVFDASILVLRDYGFRVDRKDYRFGVITTMPLDSPTILEPWRGLNSTADQASEATLNSDRRIVRVNLEPDPTGQPDYLLRVEVTVERRQQPQRRLTGSTDGYRLLGSLSRTPGEWSQRGIGSTYWTPISRDPYLEERLLAAIVRRSLQLRRTGEVPAPGVIPGVDTSQAPPTEGIETLP